MLPVSPALGLLFCAALCVAPAPQIVGGGRAGEKAPQGAGRGGETPGGARGEPAGGQRGGGEDEDLGAQYFELADYDANGWISFREAEESMGIDRAGFGLYDADVDGRITAGEFAARYQNIVGRGGAFVPPLGKAIPKKPKPLNAGELSARFDTDRDAALNEVELRALLEDAGSKLDPTVVLVKFDRDGSHRLEKAELEPLVVFLDPARRTAAGPRAQTLDELFGTAIPREERPGATRLPAHLPGPVSVFRRLDLDGDGKIELDDLIELQRPIQLPVRLHAVLATLDLDGDGTISASELAASMGKK